jgi:hypothetical protein
MKRGIFAHIAGRTIADSLLHYITHRSASSVLSKQIEDSREIADS